MRFHTSHSWWVPWSGSFGWIPAGEDGLPGVYGRVGSSSATIDGNSSW